MERKELEEKLTKQGYQHPDTINQVYSAYQIYTEKDTTPYVSQNYDPYATFNSEEKQSQQQSTQQDNICPTCRTTAMYSCPCKIGEFMCGSGHSWYFTQSGEMIVGDPHENEN